MPCRSISELLDSCRHVLAASLPPDLQPSVSELHATELGGIAAVISAERTARCARVEMLFLAQVGHGASPPCPPRPHTWREDWQFNFRNTSVRVVDDNRHGRRPCKHWASSQLHLK